MMLQSEVISLYGTMMLQSWALRKFIRGYQALHRHSKKQVKQQLSIQYLFHENASKDKFKYSPIGLLHNTCIQYLLIKDHFTPEYMPLNDSWLMEYITLSFFA